MGIYGYGVYTWMICMYMDGMYIGDIIGWYWHMWYIYVYTRHIWHIWYLLTYVECIGSIDMYLMCWYVLPGITYAGIGGYWYIMWQYMDAMYIYWWYVHVWHYWVILAYMVHICICGSICICIYIVVVAYIYIYGIHGHVWYILTPMAYIGIDSSIIMRQDLILTRKKSDSNC